MRYPFDRPWSVRRPSINNYLLSLLLWNHTSEKLSNGIGFFPIWSSCACAILGPTPPHGERGNGRGHEILSSLLHQDYTCQRVEDGVNVFPICSSCACAVLFLTPPLGSRKWMWSLGNINPVFKIWKTSRASVSLETYCYISIWSPASYRQIL